ncbi:MAG: methyltransferase domain-containing protein [Ginsengibacter sp.]
MFPKYYNRRARENYLEHNGHLDCDGLRVEIKNEIPRFAPSGSYAALFGEQWNKYKKTQLDSYSGTSITMDRLNRCLGDLRSDLHDKLVLEAGCGAGRFTECLLQKGALLVSADLSSAVEANRENFPVTDRHKIIQADIYDLPFMDESFDVVICLGVIQHTPNSEKTIGELYKLVKKGGTLVIDHYTQSRSNLLRTVPLYRAYLKRKPFNKTIAITEKLVKKYLPLHKIFANNRILCAILNRISPVVSYYRSLPQLNDQQQKEWAVLDTHDWLTDWFKHYRSKKQIIKTLAYLGAENIYCANGGNGVEARCKKPL